MCDVERLTILGGHLRAVSAAIDRLTQEFDLLYGKDPKEGKKLLELIIELAFVLEHLTEEVEEVAENLHSSFRISA